MLQEIGRVVATEPGALWVEVIAKSACGSCTAKSGCGHGLLEQMRGRRRRHLRVLNSETTPEDIQVGREVEIGLPAGAVLTASAMLYLAPLLGLLLGSVLASVYFSGDMAATLGGVAGLAFALLLVRMHALRRRNDRRWQPLLLRALPAAEAAEPLGEPLEQDMRIG